MQGQSMIPRLVEVLGATLCSGSGLSLITLGLSDALTNNVVTIGIWAMGVLGFGLTVLVKFVAREAKERTLGAEAIKSFNEYKENQEKQNKEFHKQFEEIQIALAKLTK